MDPTKIIEWAGRASVVTLLITILITGQMGIWIWGTALSDLKTDRDTWKNLALKGTLVAQQAARTAIAGPENPVSFSPLPQNVKPADIKARLDVIDSATKYKTEPTDEPVE